MNIKLKKTTSGFTLLELAVTITIFVLLTTAVLIKNSRFKNDLLVTNLAYEIALTIREAQVYGINVSATTDDPSNYSYAHGVHFDLNEMQFDLFADRDGDQVFDLEDDGAAEDTFILREGSMISMLCSVNLSGARNCSNESLDILFKRPDPEAVIHADEGGSLLKVGVVCIKSPQNVIRKIEVKSTGQISVLTDSALYSECNPLGASPSSSPSTSP